MVAAGDTGLVWLVIVVVGAGTYLIRFSFLFLFEYVEDVPPTVERTLSFVPAAVLAALVAPAVLAPGGTVTVAGNDRLLAGALAAAVAWRTENILATILTGLVALLALQAVPL